MRALTAMRITALPLLLLLESCFSPDLTSGKYSCDTTADCPRSLVCWGGRCVTPDQAVDAAAGDAASTDLAMSTEDDLLTPPGDDLAMSRPDQATRDLSMQPADLASPPPDLSPTPDLAIGGCKGDGKDLYRGQVWACRGDFSTKAGMTPDTLCNAAQGFTVCGTANAALLMNVPTGTCQSNLTGFYASAVPVDMVMESMGGSAYSVRCAPMGGAETMPFGLLGCGQTALTRPVRGGRCDGLELVLRCDGFAGAAGWTCSGGLLTASHSNAGTFGGGVLCCKP